MLLIMLSMFCCLADTLHHDAYHLCVLVLALQQQPFMVKRPSFCIQESMTLSCESGVLMGFKLWLLCSFLRLS